MKKNYFLLAASTMMFAACAQTDMVNEVVTEETPQAIGFETFTQKATRADETPAESTAENSSARYGWKLSDHHTTFKVWAYKNVSDTRVFDGVTVEYKAASDGDDGTTIPKKWSYDTPVYWDKTATTYNFYAAAPSSADWKFNGNTTNKDQAYFVMEDAKLAATNFVSDPSTEHIEVLKATGSDVDWMIADKCNVAVQSGDVPLNFIHILSRLNIIVKKSSTDDPKITLNSVTVKGLNLQGTFDESTAANTSGTTARWTPASTPVVTSDYKYTNTTDFTLSTDKNYVLQSLVIPQTVAYQSVTTDGYNLGNTPKAYVEIIYTISGEEFKAYYNLAAVFGADAVGETVAFNEGWQNTLTITISANQITFSGNVAEWADGTPTGSTTIE